MEGKVCSKCGVWKPLEEYHKSKTGKYGRKSQCKDCTNKPPKETREGMKKCIQCKQWKALEEYHKSKTGKYGRRSMCKECRKVKKEVREGMKKCTKCGVWKPLEEYYKKKTGKYGRDSKCRECHKEHGKQYRQNNTEHCKEYQKQWRENNKEYKKEQDKQYHQKNKQNNLQCISSIVEQINPVFKQLNLPVYGYVYMFENIKTKHKYLGQSILPIKTRYSFEGGIIKSWIKERLNKSNQKFKKELIEEDIVVTEVLDVAFCQYHLDKLEAYYINKYDSYNNGYNNNAGYWNRDDGIEEFNQILKENNLQFINGQLLKMEA